MNTGSKTWLGGLAGAVEKRWDWGLTGVIVTYARSFTGPGPPVSFIGVMPTLTYSLESLGEGLYLRSSGIWHLGLQGESSYIPVGLGIGKVWTLPGGATLNLHLEPQYSVYTHGDGAPRCQILTGLILQF